MSSEIAIPRYHDYREGSDPHLRELFRSDCFQLFRAATDDLDTLSRSRHLSVTGLDMLRTIEERLILAERLAETEVPDDPSLPLRIRTIRQLAPLRARTQSLIVDTQDERQRMAYEMMVLKPAYQQLLATAQESLLCFSTAADHEARGRYRGLIQEQTLFALGLRPADAHHFIVPASAQQDYLEDTMRFDALAVNTHRKGSDMKRALQVRSRAQSDSRLRDRKYRRARHATVIYGRTDMNNAQGRPIWQGSEYENQPFPTLQAMIDEAGAACDVSPRLDAITARLQRRIFS